MTAEFITWQGLWITGMAVGTFIMVCGLIDDDDHDHDDEDPTPPTGSVSA